MALNKQKIPVPFNQGIDTKTDDKQRVDGTLNTLENSLLDKPGKLRKRNGYTDVPLIKDIDSVITNTRSLTSFKKEVDVITNTTLYGYSSATTKCHEKGLVIPVKYKNYSVIKDTIKKINQGSVYLNGLEFIVYQNTAGAATGIYLSIIDSANNNFVMYDQQVSYHGISPYLVVRGSDVYIFYSILTEIYYTKVILTGFLHLDTPQLVTTMADGFSFGVSLIDTDITIVYQKLTTNIMSFRNISALDVVSAPYEIAAETNFGAICMTTDSSKRVVCSYSTNLGGTKYVKAVVVDKTLTTTVLAPTNLDSFSSSFKVNRTSIHETATNTYVVAYSFIVDPQNFNYIKRQSVTTAGTIGTATDVYRGLTLQSNIFKRGSSYYCLASYLTTSGTQNSMFLIDIYGAIITRMLTGSIDLPGSNSYNLQTVSVIDSNRYSAAIPTIGITYSNGTSLVSITGVDKLVLDFSVTSAPVCKEISNNLHIANGLLKMYDGTRVVEHGFHMYPDKITLTGITSGYMSDGTYEYIVVYAWTDAQGIIHRSAPSIAVPITLSAGTSTQSVQVIIETLKLTEKTDVILEVYRTENAGTIFYKVSQTTGPTISVPTVDTNTFYDTTTDADLIDNEVLYTTGDVLENTPASQCTSMEEHQSRIFTSVEGESKINYSKIVEEGFPVEFNDSLYIPISDKGGDIKYLKSIKEKLIIFKENAIFYVSGSGPNNLGENGDFTVPEIITEEIGCVDADSVVSIPSGIMFKSANGIYMLGKGLSTTYIGAPVEAFNNLTITSANAVAEHNQVRFLTSDGSCLVYNYELDKWSTYTNHSGKNALVLDQNYYYLRNDDKLYLENTSYSDAGSSIVTKIESGWLSFAGVQNYQRVYRLLVLGAWKSTHDIRVSIAYNFIDTYTQVEVIPIADFATSTANQYQFRVDLDIQKCESIKIKIEDILATPGESFEISNISFVVGTKDTEYKVNEPQQFGK